MKKKLQQLINDYEFLSADIDIKETLEDAIRYIEKLEADYKGLEEIIAIQRHNMAVMRNKRNNPE